jgi:hypothetical protein
MKTHQMESKRGLHRRRALGGAARSAFQMCNDQKRSKYKCCMTTAARLTAQCPSPEQKDKQIERTIRERRKTTTTKHI